MFLSLKFRANAEANNKIENKDLYNKEVAIILSVKLSLKVEEEKKHKDAADESQLIQQRKSGGNNKQAFPAMENKGSHR